MPVSMKSTLLILRFPKLSSCCSALSLQNFHFSMICKEIPFPLLLLILLEKYSGVLQMHQIRFHFSILLRMEKRKLRDDQTYFSRAISRLKTNVNRDVNLLNANELFDTYFLQDCDIRRLRLQV